MLGYSLVQHVGGRIVLPDPLKVGDGREREEGLSRQKGVRTR